LDPTTRAAWLGAYTLCPPAIKALHLTRAIDIEFTNKSGVKDLPVLNVHGTADQRLDYKGVEDYIKSIYNNVDSHILPGVGHAIFEEEPEKLKSAIFGFAEKLYQ
jgi:pimeloyl-ACP methyl ester carboxylesterase